MSAAAAGDFLGAFLPVPALSDMSTGAKRECEEREGGKKAEKTTPQTDNEKNEKNPWRFQSRFKRWRIKKNDLRMIRIPKTGFKIFYLLVERLGRILQENGSQLALANAREQGQQTGEN